MSKQAQIAVAVAVGISLWVSIHVANQVPSDWFAGFAGSMLLMLVMTFTFIVLPVGLAYDSTEN